MSPVEIPDWLLLWNLRIRLPLSVAVATAVYLLLPQMSPLRHALGTWEAGVITFLLLAWINIAAAEPRHIRDFAKQQDIRTPTIFLLVIGAAASSLVALALLLASAKESSTPLVGLDVLLTVVAVFSSWILTHTAYTVHYAHNFYLDDESGNCSLEFPGEKEPDYWDFAYFSFVIGMTFQVSDVQITSNPMRRIALVHSLLSFVFNTVILALSVNLAAGLVK